MLTNLSWRVENIRTCMVAKWLATYAPATFETPEMIFPVTGPSFLPCDRVFDFTEKVLKKQATILTKEDYHLQPNLKWKQQLRYFKISACKCTVVRKTKKSNIVVRSEITFNSNTGAERLILKKHCLVDEINPVKIPLEYAFILWSWLV